MYEGVAAASHDHPRADYGLAEGCRGGEHTGVVRFESGDGGCLGLMQCA